MTRVRRDTVQSRQGSIGGETQKWSQRSGSNRRPAHYECAALPAELRWPLTREQLDILFFHLNTMVGRIAVKLPGRGYCFPCGRSPPRSSRSVSVPPRAACPAPGGYLSPRCGACPVFSGTLFPFQRDMPRPQRAGISLFPSPRAVLGKEEGRGQKRSGQVPLHEQPEVTVTCLPPQIRNVQ